MKAELIKAATETKANLTITGGTVSTGFGAWVLTNSTFFTLAIGAAGVIIGLIFHIINMRNNDERLAIARGERDQETADKIVIALNLSEEDAKKAREAIKK